MSQEATNDSNPYAPVEDLEGERGPSVFAWLAFASINIKVCALLIFFLPQNGVLCVIPFVAVSLIVANAVGGDALAPLSAKPMTLIERLVVVGTACVLLALLGTEPMSATSIPGRSRPPAAPAASIQEVTPEHASPIENRPDLAEDDK